MIRNIINVSPSPVTLDDLNGITIEVDEVVDGLQFGIVQLQESNDLIQALLSGLLKLHDGTYLYETGRAINLLKDNVDQLTKDGKRIITASDRPKDHYRHFTSSGDDVANQIRGGGQQLIFVVAPGDTSVVDCVFIDDVYVKDGTIAFENAAIGSHASVEIVAPIGIPYPAIFANGNYDFINGSFVANNSNTGAYFINMQNETVFLRFVNKVLMLGTNTIETTAPEPSFLPSQLIERFTIYNASTTETLRAVIYLGIYRKRTV